MDFGMIEALNKYKKDHPPETAVFNVSDVSTKQYKAKRIDYSQLEIPKELKEKLLNSSFIEGEKFYWENGLREQLMEQGKKGQFVATDGKEIECSQDLHQLYAVLNSKFPMQSFFFAKIGEEGIPSKCIQQL